MKLFPKIQNPWPVGLLVFFTVFTTYIVGFVVFASRQKMDLVRPDYYDQEIRFQQQIDRARRTDAMLAEAGIDYDRGGERVTVSLPAVKPEGTSGTVSFYRPSDAGLDTNVKLGLDEQGRQKVDVRLLAAGLWRVRVQWSVGGREYFFERPIVIVRRSSS